MKEGQLAVVVGKYSKSKCDGQPVKILGEVETTNSSSIYTKTYRCALVSGDVVEVQEFDLQDIHTLYEKFFQVKIEHQKLESMIENFKVAEKAL